LTIPDISVIVPVHNSFKYLSPCLDSLLNQTYQNIEIVCVNDGSCDGSGLLLKKYAQKDKRIKIKTTDCYGVGNARNVGMDMATGKYIFFMDSDDLLHQDALAHFMKIATQTNADIVCGKYKKVKNPDIQEGKKLSGHFSVETNPISCFGQRPPKTPVTVWNKLFKKEVIGESRFLPKVYFEDTAFTLEVFSKARSCALVPDETYLYRTGNHSIMRSANSEQKINDFCKVLAEVEKKFGDKPQMYQLIFSTYLNPELLSLLSFRFGVSRHLRRYMNDHIQPVIQKIKKQSTINSPDSGLKNSQKFYKTRLLFRILKEKICRN